MPRDLPSLLETSTETALIPRRDPTINAALELLDARYLEAADGPADRKLINAWASLRDDEVQWIDDQIYKCRYDRRYYLENYHCIKTERGEAKALTLWAHQEYVLEILDDLWAKNGYYHIILLKPRQVGMSTFALALIFQSTIFNPRKNTMMMAQNISTTTALYQQLWDAYNALPWWLRPELEQKVQANRFVFQRANRERRVSSPGLGSTLRIANAQMQSGVAIGSTIANGLYSEMSRWPDSDMWTSDIVPSMNAPDAQVIIESTAHGRGGVFFNLWTSAEKGEEDCDWTPIFVPVYRVKKYFLPIPKGSAFVLTSEEKAVRERVALPIEKGGENFTIPLGFFNWQRRKIKAYIDAERSAEGLYRFRESYPTTAKEAFITSGFCAFPRFCLDYQEEANCLPPIWIGEIEYQDERNRIFHPPLPTPEQIKRGEVNYLPEQITEKPDKYNCLWLWELPAKDDSVQYYVSADVSGGMAKDYSCAQVIKLANGMEPKVQVAMWHGKMEPSHFARVIAALGYWYNTAEVAVEYQSAGVTTGDELQHYLDYPNLYRWKQMDKISNTMTVHTHWMTTHKTRENAINRVNEGLLDHTLVIRNKLLIEEMRNFGRLGSEDRAEGFEDSDDATMALAIAMGASAQLGRSAAEPSARSYAMPAVPRIYALFDHFMRQIPDTQTDDLEKIKKIIDDTAKKYNGTVEEVMGTNSMSDPTPRLKGWRVVANGMMLVTARELMVMQANTPFSPIHDSSSAEHDLHYRHDVPERKIVPEIVQIYREILTTQHYEGDD